MRKSNPVLVYGDLKFSVADDKKMVLVYERTMGSDAIVVAFNRSDSTRIVNVPVKTDGEYEDLLSGSMELFKSTNKEISVTMKPVSGVVLKKKS
jgi:glycosidase